MPSETRTDGDLVSETIVARDLQLRGATSRRFLRILVSRSLAP